LILLRKAQILSIKLLLDLIIRIWVTAVDTEPPIYVFFNFHRLTPNREIYRHLKIEIAK